MPKITALKQGGNIKGYRITLKKREIEKHNFINASCKIEYTDNSIIILREKEDLKK